MTTTMNQEQLEPCPFCGSEVDLQWTTCWVVDCPKCGHVRQFGGDYDTAVRKWNTRAGRQLVQAAPLKYFVNESGRLEFEKPNSAEQEAKK